MKLKKTTALITSLALMLSASVGAMAGETKAATSLSGIEDEIVSSQAAYLASGTGDEVESPQVVYVTLTYDLNGGTAEFETAVQLEEGTIPTKPITPTCDGYVFSGWYLDGTAYNFDTAITEDTTLTAKWVKYSVNIVPRGTDVDTETEALDVYAEDEVEVYLYVDNDEDDAGFSNAQWQIKYNPAEFQYVSAELKQGSTYVNTAKEGNDTISTYVLGTTGKDEYLTGENNTLVVYTFKAIPQSEDFVTSSFIISDTYVDTYLSASSDDKVLADNTGTVTVNIINKDLDDGLDFDTYEKDTEEDGSGDDGSDGDDGDGDNDGNTGIEVGAEGVNQVYDGKTYVIEGVSTVEGAVITYSLDGFVTETKEAPIFKNVTNSTLSIKASMPGYKIVTKEYPIVITQREPVVTFDYEILDNQTISSDVKFTVTLSNLVDDSYCGTTWVYLNDKAYSVDLTYDAETNTSTGIVTVPNVERGITAYAGYVEGVNDNYSSAVSETVTTHNYYIEVVNNTERNEGVQDYVSSIADEGNGFIYVLVYTNEDDLYFEYADKDFSGLMYEVTAAGYHYTDDNLVSYDDMFNHIYGLVVPALDTEFTPSDYRNNVSIAEGVTEDDLTVINTYNEDINFTDIIDVNDVTAGFAVYNGNANYLSNLMRVVLKADVNRDKLVDINDINLIKQAAHIA